MNVLGVDVDSSGVKGAIVDTVSGYLLTECHCIQTPQPYTPASVAEAIRELVIHFAWTGLVGCAFPAVVTHGMARSAANIDDAFIGTNLNFLFSNITGTQIYCVNNADAAGTAEVYFGQGKEVEGTVIMVTICTGLGTAIFVNGQLVPNTELGHMYLNNGIEAEAFTADATAKNQQLGPKEWVERFNHYLASMEALFWPDLFILDGGANKKLDSFAEHLSIRTPVVAASMLNEAGIVGAAIFAANESSS